MGMVGGGGEAFIGGIHQMAAQLDGKIGLIAGAFSSNWPGGLRSLAAVRCADIPLIEEGFPL